MESIWAALRQDSLSALKSAAPPQAIDRQANPSSSASVAAESLEEHVLSYLRIFKTRCVPVCSLAR